MPTGMIPQGKQEMVEILQISKLKSVGSVHQAGDVPFSALFPMHDEVSS